MSDTTAFLLPADDPRIDGLEETAATFFETSLSICEHETARLVLKDDLRGEEPEPFSRRNAVFMAITALANVAGREFNTTADEIMTAVGQASGFFIVGQEEAGYDAATPFFSGLAEAMPDRVFRPDEEEEIPGEIAPEADDEKGPIQ